MTGTDKNLTGSVYGFLLMVLLAAAAVMLGETEVARQLSISPLIIGIILGMVFANTLKRYMPETWEKGIGFCSKRILRLGIVLYGFRLTFMDVADVGLKAVCVDGIVVCGTLLLGLVLGRMLRMDRDTTLLTSIGSAICGAAAVLGAEGVVRAKPYKTAVAVSTVVIFGTLSMFLYPAAYSAGLLSLTPWQMGIYCGCSVHEVAHVVGAAGALGDSVAGTAIIVKMIRVMMLVPVLLVLGYVEARRAGSREGQRVAIPWFALLFLGVIGLNSLSFIPQAAVNGVNTLDMFLLTMAMTALGSGTTVDKFKAAGLKPFVLAALLAVWLMAGGYVLASFC